MDIWGMIAIFIVLFCQGAWYNIQSNREAEARCRARQQAADSRSAAADVTADADKEVGPPPNRLRHGPPSAF